MFKSLKELLALPAVLKAHNIKMAIKFNTVIKKMDKLEKRLKETTLSRDAQVMNDETLWAKEQEAQQEAINLYRT